MLIHLIGFIAALISFTMFVPQAISTWKARNNPTALLGISLGTQFMIVANAILWACYGVLTEAFWTAAPGIVNLPLALYTIISIYTARKHLKANPEQPVLV